MSRLNRKSGFTLVEVLIVVVIMAVLAATIIPQFSNSSQDAKVSTSKFNLSSIRSVLQLYKAQHNGIFPATLDLLTVKTTAAGATAGGNLGPYLQAIPEESFSAVNTVATGTLSTDDTFTTGKGWHYAVATGEIRINSAYDPDGAATVYLPLNQW